MIIIIVILGTKTMMLFVNSWKNWLWKIYFSAEPETVTRENRKYIEDWKKLI